MNAICLLRGVNVSGQKRILMADLKLLFEQQGFTEVSTYIQSGNVRFETPQTDPRALEAQIAEALKRRFGFDVEVFVLPKAELVKAYELCPFRDRALNDGENVYFTFLSALPKTEGVEKLLSMANDDETPSVVGTTFYLFSRGGYGRSAFANTFIEKTLGCRATTRNIATVRFLLT